MIQNKLLFRIPTRLSKYGKQGIFKNSNITPSKLERLEYYIYVIFNAVQCIKIGLHFIVLIGDDQLGRNHRTF